MVLLALLVVQLPVAQTPPQTSPEIFVEGQREIPRRPGDPGTAVAPATQAALQNRKIYDNAQRVAKCMMRRSRDELRAAVDGDMNSHHQRQAMIGLIEHTAYCNSNGTILRQSRFVTAGGAAMSMAIGSGFYAANGAETDMSLSGVSVYDRGALIEEVIGAFAPDLTLTRRQTYDRAVQKRFDAAEVPRNRYRDSLDFKYFATVVCMVRMEPVLAVAMLRAPAGSVDQGRAQANMIDRARACVGNARKVKVDGVQFRAYVADAVYRWTVAARGVATLIPAA